jgi:hypothetical protein
MSTFQTLGDAVGGIPKVVKSVETTLGEGAAKVANYVTSNFKLPNLSQKAAELGDKLVKTGISKLFGSAVVKPGALAKSVSGGLEEALAANAATGFPAGLLPFNNQSTPERKVIIKQKPEVGFFNTLVLDVMPRIDERGGADYEAVQPLHHPGVIQKFRATQARSWGISGRLISRNVAEATKNLEIMNMIRSWRMPFYGEGTSLSNLNEFLGAPPPILELSAYGPDAIGPVMCVLKDYNWAWENDRDYIPTDKGTPVPVIMEISLTLEESWSPAEFSSFDLASYKQGKMLGGAFAQGRIREPNQEPPIPEAQSEQTTLTTGDFARLDRSELVSGLPTPSIPVLDDVYHGGTNGVGGATAIVEAGGNTLTF